MIFIVFNIEILLTMFFFLKNDMLRSVLFYNSFELIWSWAIKFYLTLLIFLRFEHLLIVHRVLCGVCYRLVFSFFSFVILYAPICYVIYRNIFYKNSSTLWYEKKKKRCMFHILFSIKWLGQMHQCKWTGKKKLNNINMN